MAQPSGKLSLGVSHKSDGAPRRLGKGGKDVPPSPSQTPGDFTACFRGSVTRVRDENERLLAG